MPKIIDDEISDIKCCKFIVALTRTRKQCHIISNKWLISPKTHDGKWAEKFERSQFIEMIPSELIDDQGDKKSADIN
jgi:superfamily I DNA/RNA helicase